MKQEQLPRTGASMDEYAMQAMVTIQHMADSQEQQQQQQDGQREMTRKLSVIEHQERELLQVDPSKLQGVAKVCV